MATRRNELDYLYGNRSLISPTDENFARLMEPTTINPEVGSRIIDLSLIDATKAFGHKIMRVLRLKQATAYNLPRKSEVNDPGKTNRLANELAQEQEAYRTATTRRCELADKIRDLERKIKDSKNLLGDNEALIKSLTSELKKLKSQVSAHQTLVNDFEQSEKIAQWEVQMASESGLQQLATSMKVDVLKALYNRTTDNKYKAVFESQTEIEERLLSLETNLKHELANADPVESNQNAQTQYDPSALSAEQFNIRQKRLDDRVAALNCLMDTLYRDRITKTKDELKKSTRAKKQNLSEKKTTDKNRKNHEKLNWPKLERLLWHEFGDQISLIRAWQARLPKMSKMGPDAYISHVTSISHDFDTLRTKVEQFETDNHIVGLVSVLEEELGIKFASRSLLAAPVAPAPARAPSNNSAQANVPPQWNTSGQGNVSAQCNVPPQGNTPPPSNVPPQGNTAPPSNVPPQGNTPPPSNVPPQGNTPPPSNVPPQGNTPPPGNVPPQGNTPPPSNVPPQGNTPPSGNVPPQGNTPPPSNVPPQGNTPPSSNVPPQGNTPPSGNVPPQGNTSPSGNVPPQGNVLGQPNIVSNIQVNPVVHVNQIFHTGNRSTYWTTPRPASKNNHRRSSRYNPASEGPDVPDAPTALALPPAPPVAPVSPAAPSETPAAPQPSPTSAPSSAPTRVPAPLATAPTPTPRVTTLPSPAPATKLKVAPLPAPTSPEAQSTGMEIREILAPSETLYIGDLNGSVEALRLNLLSLKAIEIDRDGRWIWTGGNRTLTMIGDSLCDRTTEGLQILYRLRELKDQMNLSKIGEILIFGNHEDLAVSFLTGRAGGGEMVERDAQGIWNELQLGYNGIWQGEGVLEFIQRFSAIGQSAKDTADLKEKLKTIKDLEGLCDEVRGNMQSSAEGLQILEKICEMKPVHLEDGNLIFHTEPSYEMLATLAEGDDLMENVLSINADFKKELRDLLLNPKADMAGHPEYTLLCSIFFNPKNRDFYTSSHTPEVQPLLAKLHKAGVIRIIHGHSSDNLHQIYTTAGIEIVNLDFGFGKVGSFDPDTRSIAYLGMDKKIHLGKANAEQIPPFDLAIPLISGVLEKISGKEGIYHDMARDLVVLIQKSPDRKALINLFLEQRFVDFMADIIRGKLTNGTVDNHYLSKTVGILNIMDFYLHYVKDSPLPIAEILDEMGGYKLSQIKGIMPKWIAARNTAPAIATTPEAAPLAINEPASSLELPLNDEQVQAADLEKLKELAHRNLTKVFGLNANQAEILWRVLQEAEIPYPDKFKKHIHTICQYADVLEFLFTLKLSGKKLLSHGVKLRALPAAPKDVNDMGSSKALVVLDKVETVKKLAEIIRAPQSQDALRAALKGAKNLYDWFKRLK